MRFHGHGRKQGAFGMAGDVFVISTPGGDGYGTGAERVN
jgi:N-methylhydantoinase B/oxoprolinase/acetone carboxylase alpha subunit